MEFLIILLQARVQSMQNSQQMAYYSKSTDAPSLRDDSANAIAVIHPHAVTRRVCWRRNTTTKNIAITWPFLVMRQSVKITP